MFFRRQESQDLYNISVAVMWRKMQREVNMDAHLKKDFTLSILPIIIPFSLVQQAISIVAAWQFSPEENDLDPELCGIFGATRVSV